MTVAVASIASCIIHHTALVVDTVLLAPAVWST